MAHYRIYFYKSLGKRKIILFHRSIFHWPFVPLMNGEFSLSVDTAQQINYCVLFVTPLNAKIN